MKRTNYIFLLAMLFLIPASLLNGCGQTDTYPPEKSVDGSFDYAKAHQTLTSHVFGAVSRVENTLPEGEPAEQQTQFFSLKHEIESVEDELNDYDHQLENDLLANTLSLEDYQTHRARLGNLEDLLASAEERLDFSFGMEL